MQTGINGILDRIAAMANQDTFSSIEKDLLLQYTRELYEHILNTEITALVVQTPEPKTAVNVILSEADDNTFVSGEPEHQVVEHSDIDSEQTEELENNAAAIHPEEVLPAAEPAMDDKPDALDEKETTAIIDIAEADGGESVIAQVNEGSINIKTQLDATLPKAMEDDITVEEEPKKVEDTEIEASDPEEPILLHANERPFQEPEDFELEPELKNEKAFDPKNLIDFRLWNRDIRSYIGINDKYNFISELFSNNAEAYEEILNEINSMETAEEARYFLENSGVTTLYKWKEDGFSEQIFYNVLNQFFPAR